MHDYRDCSGVKSEEPCLTGVQTMPSGLQRVETEANRSRKELVVSVSDRPQRQSFLIYRRLLLRHSDYFRRCLAGGFKEVSTDIVVLEDEDPFIFEHPAQWPIGSRLEESLEGTGSTGEEGKFCVHRFWRQRRSEGSGEGLFGLGV